MEGVRCVGHEGHGPLSAQTCGCASAPHPHEGWGQPDPTWSGLACPTSACLEQEMQVVTGAIPSCPKVCQPIWARPVLCAQTAGEVVLQQARPS